jgi:putative FmdB family regulatory protein
MPTYDYQCGKCGVEFEREQRITEPPVKTCPKCKSRQVKRLLSAPGFILKGGGWYADGYGSGGKKASSSSDSGSSSSSSESTSSSSSSSGDGKPSSGGSSEGGKSSKSAA